MKPGDIPRQREATGGRDPVGPVAVRRFGKYYLVKKLAEGGMAEIFLAKQVGLEGFEKNIVLKRMLSHLSTVPDFVAMFLDEANLAAKLNHPNVVQIHDLGIEEGYYFIAMEHLPGEDFSTIIRSHAAADQYVPIHIAVRIVAEAAHGLHYAHTFTGAKGVALQIVHRDVSPANILVTYTGQVKVLDFGIAKAESRLTTTNAGVVKGKYQYMSPEQAVSEPVDQRADVYSLGVCLYEALTNVRPFARDTDLAILNAVVRNDYPPPRQARADLPPELERVIVKALSPERETRYQSALELASELEGYLQAMMSSGGGTMLAQFMTQHFGAERVESRTRVGTLAELQAGAPGSVESEQPAPAGSSGEVPDLATPSPPAPRPSQPPAPRPSRPRPPPRTEPVSASSAETAPTLPQVASRRVVLLAGAGTLALVVLAAVLFLWPARRDVPAQVVTVGPTTGPGFEVAHVDVQRPVAVAVQPPVAPTVDAGALGPPAHPEELAPDPQRPRPPPPKEPPTAEALAARIEALGARARERTDLDPSALQYLVPYRIEAMAADTSARRAELARTLDQWEHTFLPKR